MRYRDDHQTVFFMVNSPDPPWICFYCQEDIWFMDGWYKGVKQQWSLVIHHMDGDHSNNSVSNLHPAHSACHTVFHSNQRRIQRIVQGRIVAEMNPWLTARLLAVTKRQPK